MAKLDLAEACKHIIIRPQDWHLCGSTFDVTDVAGDPVRQHYVEMVLLFGLSSAPKLFNVFADGLEYIMKARSATVCEHFLDDYFTAGPPETDICHNNLKII